MNVLVWHPESPGSHLIVYRPWWKRKLKPFATLGEVIRSRRYYRTRGGPVHDVRDLLRNYEGMG